jgi:hypothetical protein
MGLTRPRASQIYDIDYKQSVRVIATTNVTLSGGAPTVVDGVTLSPNDRVLVTGQSTASQNGIYTVSILGTGSNGTWIRSTDTNATGELDSGTIVMVTQGSAYADTSWKLTTNDPIVIGTTALTFEINTGNAFGTISANGTAIVSNSASGTVTFSTGNNIVITGNAGSDTITFAVKEDPIFVNTVTFNGNITGNLLPSANVTYNLGSPTQRWKEIFLAANTIDIGGALISADLTTGSLILTGPDGAEFILTGNSPNTSVGHFGMMEISNAMSSHNTTSGALTVVGGAGIGGNVNVGGILDIVGNSIHLGNLLLKDNGANIFGLYAADGVTPATISQSSVDTTKISNGTSNVQVVSSNANVSIGVDGVGNVGVFYSGGLAIVGDLSVTGNATLSGNILGDRIVNGTTNIEVQTVSGNANISVGGVSNVAVFTPIGLNITGNLVGSNIESNALTSTVTLSATGNATVGNLGTAGLITATGNITGGNLITGAQVIATGNITGSNIVTAGQVSGSTLTASGNVVVQSRQQVKLYDTDNSNFISLRAPNALTGDFLLTLPTGYGNADQVLSTNGSGGLAWVDQSGGGGGGSATSYPNSTVQPVPGATGNFDLSYNFVQTVQESGFESSATDPFGVNLGEVYSMMDPVGEVLEGVDLGVLT